MNAWKNRKRWLRQLLAGGLLGLAGGTLAEDIDLFLGPPTAATGAPNVLFVLDNSTNWESIFEDWKGALQTVFEALPDKGINIGIMMFTPSSGGAANSGGYVRAGIREMTDDSGSVVGTKTLFSEMIGALESGGDTSDGESSGKISNTMAEAYAYFSKSAPRSGDGRDKTDYDGNDYSGPSGTCCAEAQEIWALPNSLDTSPIGMNALTGKNASPYQNILDEDSCAGNSIIVISNGPTQDATPINNASADYLATVSGETPSVIDLTDYVEEVAESENPVKAAENWADEWARFMKQESDLEITTYTIDINVNPENGQGPNMTMLLKSMAVEGEGQYYDLRGQETFDPNDLVGALDDILSRILARNSVFASVALPASAGTSSTFLNQVFVGLFRPDANQRPQWPGNLKQYKLGFDPDDNLLKVVDADDEPIATTDTNSQNIIVPCARSIWTPENDINRQPYWAFLNDTGGCLVGGDSADYDTPDGPIVEKGGHAYVLRASEPADRVVYTCSATLADCKDDADVLTDFDASGSTPSAADLDIDAADLANYVNWTIGFDPNDANSNGERDDMRPYVHGDVVHSRPVALDYNLDPNDPDVVVFYGANDGMLRAINGNPDGSGAGSEYWSFLPPEFYPYVKVRRENTSVIGFPSSGVYAGSGIDKPYAMDGPLATYANDSDDDGDYDDVYLYAGMHRGGRVVYALEVSDINAMPDLKWKIGCMNDPNDPDDCTTGTNEIGQTWSPFSIISAAGYDSGDTPLLIMGGGYDNCEDNDAGTGGANHDCDFDGSGGDDNTGNRIYVLNALTGAILKTFETDRPVPGAVTVVPYVEGSVSYENLIKYAYAADTGGNVYRISAETSSGSGVVRDIQNAAPADWIITKIASLGCDEAEANGSDCTDGNPSNRKFIYGPDVVEIPDTEFLAVLVGSGDREKPLTDYESAYNVQNYFFSIVDHPLTPGWLDDSGIDSGICDQVDGEDVLCMDSLTELGLDGVAGLAEGETLSQWGWKFPLDDHEQVVSGSLTIANNVYFSTHIPAVYEAGECEGNLGDAFTYELDYLSADGKSTEIIGGGLVPTPVAGKVIIDGYPDPVPFCIGCGGENSPIGGTQVSGSIDWDQPKNRVYWNIKQ